MDTHFSGVRDLDERFSDASVRELKHIIVRGCMILKRLSLVGCANVSDKAAAEIGAPSAFLAEVDAQRTSMTPDGLKKLGHAQCGGMEMCRKSKMEWICHFVLPLRPTDGRAQLQREAPQLHARLWHRLWHMARSATEGIGPCLLVLGV